jgi:hypothetical protein
VSDTCHAIRECQWKKDFTHLLVIQRRVKVHVPQTWYEKLASSINYLRTARQTSSPCLSERNDSIAGYDHRGI